MTPRLADSLNNLRRLPGRDARSTAIGGNPHPQNPPKTARMQISHRGVQNCLEWEPGLSDVGIVPANPGVAAASPIQA